MGGFFRKRMVFGSERNSKGVAELFQKRVVFWRPAFRGHSHVCPKAEVITRDIYYRGEEKAPTQARQNRTQISKFKKHWADQTIPDKGGGISTLQCADW